MLGILSLPLIFVCGIGLVTGVAAVVLGALGLRKISQQPGLSGRGLAIGGIVTGAISVVAALLFVVLVLLAGDSVNEEFDGINSDPSDGFCDQDRFIEDPDC